MWVVAGQVVESGAARGLSEGTLELFECDGHPGGPQRDGHVRWGRPRVTIHLTIWQDMHTVTQQGAQPMPRDGIPPESRAKGNLVPKKCHNMQNRAAPKTSYINSFCTCNGILSRRLENPAAIVLRQQRVTHPPTFWSENRSDPAFSLKFLWRIVVVEVLGNLFVERIGVGPYSNIDEHFALLTFIVAVAHIPSDIREACLSSDFAQEFANQSSTVLDDDLLSPGFQEFIYPLRTNFPLDQDNYHSGATCMSLRKVPNSRLIRGRTRAGSEFDSSLDQDCQEFGLRLWLGEAAGPSVGTSH